VQLEINLHSLHQRKREEERVTFHLTFTPLMVALQRKSLMSNLRKKRKRISLSHK
jgi:hypothetical protein